MYLDKRNKGRILRFFGWILAAIGATYFAPPAATSAFFVIALISYYRSDDEPFWLAFFLVTADGVFGFFEGGDALVALLPGIPPVAAAQFYFMVAFIKALQTKPIYKPFYKLFLNVLLVYLIFLMVQGQVLGLSTQLNIQFRVVKLLLPFTLFFSLPRLFKTEDDFHESFKLIFLISFMALFTQFFTLAFSVSPARFFGVAPEDKGEYIINAKRIYRGFYNGRVILITFFFALVALASKSKHFNPLFLYGVLAADFFAVFLSATRGWMVAMVMILGLFFGYIYKFNVRQISRIVVVASVVIGILMAIPIFRLQVGMSIDRMMTMESLAEGDMTAGGTLRRMNVRSPIVVNKWKESMLTGWGFSDEFFEFKDPHVGNQNILMHSGVVGFVLLMSFFIYFNGKIFMRSLSLPDDSKYKKTFLIFPIFFVGWFFIHSTSTQYFAYYAAPGGAMVQAIFMVYAAVLYRDTTKLLTP